MRSLYAVCTKNRKIGSANLNIASDAEQMGMLQEDKDDAAGIGSLELIKTHTHIRVYPNIKCISFSVSQMQLLS
jgi:hypothetical protein